MVLMAIIIRVNKRMELSWEFTKEKPRTLEEFYYKVDHYLQLEEVDAEMGSLVQLMAVDRPKPNSGVGNEIGYAPKL